VSGHFSHFKVGRASAWRGEASAKTGARQSARPANIQELRDLGIEELKGVVNQIFNPAPCAMSRKSDY
jgi:hypothetical protein